LRSVQVSVERRSGRLAPFEERLRLALCEECVEKWLGRYERDSYATYRSQMKHWLVWFWSRQDEQRDAVLHNRPVQRSMPESLLTVQMPSELLTFQEKAKDRLRFAVVDLLEEHSQQKGGTEMSMIVRLTNLRQFWVKNRVDIPSTADWRPHPTREPAQGQLTDDKVKEIILRANLRNQAIFLTMFQGMMDLKRFCLFNLKYASKLTTHLQTQGIDEPFRIDFAGGRKRNRRPYHTYIYRDALHAWELYFNRASRWPNHGEPIALDARNKPISKGAISEAFNTIARSLHLKPKKGSDIGHRTGVAPHEAFRDVTRTLLQTAVMKDRFDPVCAELWMGHRVDPYNYMKIHEQKPEYVLANARIAAKYLNIISSELAHDNSENQLMLKLLKDRVEGLEKLLDQKLGYKLPSEQTS
jgi:hypothetical protein